MALLPSFAWAMSRMPSVFRGLSGSNQSPAPSSVSPQSYNLNDRACVAGNSSQTELANSFHQFNEPATSRFQTMIRNGHQPSCSTGAPFQTSPSQIRAANDISAVADRLRQSSFPIRAQCMIAALSRQTATPAFHCPTENSQGGTPMNNHQCFTRPMVDFIHQSVENAISCIRSTSGVSLDPLTVFKKINNESGFKPYYSYRGGHGIGQLIGGTAAGISQGRQDFGSLMSGIAQSTDSTCTDFKDILQNDQSNPIRGSNAVVANGRCRFISMGQGMQRNLIYSLMLRASLNRTMTSEFQRRFPNENIETPQNRELIGNLVNIGYGPRGPAGALALVRSAARGSIQSLQGAVGRNSYIRAINGAYSQVLQLTNSSATTQEQRDQACLVN